MWRDQYKLSLMPVLLFSLGLKAEVPPKTKALADSLFICAKRATFTSRKQAVELCEKSLEYYSSGTDTAKIATIKLYLVQNLTGVGLFHQAYQHIWEVYPLVQAPQYIEQNVDLTFKIISLYLIFEQNKLANTFFYSNYDHLLTQIKSNSDSTALLRTLNSIQGWLEVAANKNYLKAEEVISRDFSNGYQVQEIDNLGVCYAKLQLAGVYLDMYRFKEAAEIMFALQQRFTDRTYHINYLINYQISNYYHETHAQDSAIVAYENCLKQIEKLKVHTDHKPIIQEKLADLYHQNGQLEKAYHYLTEYTKTNTALFGSKSKQNKALFELRDEYGKKIQEQELVLLQRERDVLLLRSVIYVGALLLVIVIILVYFFQKDKKNKLQQQLLKEKQILELNTQKEVLEVKDKELLSSAMQLIERDSQLHEIKKQLNALEVRKANEPVINNIIRSLKVNRNQKWKEFEVHFSAVNHNFFESLKRSFPSLTQTDLKICAFIKLGFSSKDMAQVMGVGAEGINTTRSRLRKKMKLDRAVVLVEYLQSFRG